jgi:hypothetical protein
MNRLLKNSLLAQYLRGFVSGHDFSHAAKAHKMSWALELIRK